MEYLLSFYCFQSGINLKVFLWEFFIKSIVHQLHPPEETFDVSIADCDGHQLSKRHKCSPICRADWPPKLDAEQNKSLHGRAKIFPSSFCIGVGLGFHCLQLEFIELQSVLKGNQMA